eukprot:26829_1
MVAIWSILVGTIPSGRATFANWVSILLGFVAMLFHAVFTSEFAIHKTGRFDIFTEIYLRCARDKEFLMRLKEDTVRAYETGAPVPLRDSGKLIEDSEDADVVKEVDVEKSVSKDGSSPQAVRSMSIGGGSFPNPEQAATEDDLENQEPAQAAEEPMVEEHFSGEEEKT